MKKKLLVVVATWLFVFCVSGTTGATIIYSENFDTNPNYTTLNARPGDVMEWDSSSQSYRVYWPTDGHEVNVFALSPTFNAINNSSFSISVDMMTKSMTWGHHMGIHFGNSNNFSNQSHLKITSNWTNDYSISDGLGNRYDTGSAPKNTWFTFGIDYNNSTNTTNFLVTNRDTGVMLYQNTVVNFTQTSFDQIYLGQLLLNSEGNTAEMYFDNITVAAKPVPEPTTMLLLGTGIAGLLGTKFRRKKK